DRRAASPVDRRHRRPHAESIPFVPSATKQYTSTGRYEASPPRGTLRLSRRPAGTERTNPMKVTAFVMVAALALATTAHAQTKKLNPRGTGGFGAGTTAPLEDSIEGRREGPEQNRSFQRFITGSVSRSRVPASHVPTPDGLPVSLANPAFLSLTHLDQIISDSGNQFSTEPPDQGLAIGGTNQCAGGPCILAAVNSAIAAYTTTGQRLATVSMNQFFGL